MSYKGCLVQVGATPGKTIMILPPAGAGAGLLLGTQVCMTLLGRLLGRPLLPADTAGIIRTLIPTQGVGVGGQEKNPV